MQILHSFFIGDTSTPPIPVIQDNRSILPPNVGMLVLGNHKNTMS